VFEQFARTAVDHHTQHAAAWNAILRAAGKPAMLGTPLSTQPNVAAELGSARTLSAVVAVAARLEDQAVRTFAAAAASIQGATTFSASTAASTEASTAASASATAASIAPVEAMHAAVLRFLSGAYPSPDDMLGSGGAAIAELTA
jgi:hypothetical protein